MSKNVFLRNVFACLLSFASLFCPCFLFSSKHKFHFHQIVLIFSLKFHFHFLVNQISHLCHHLSLIFTLFQFSTFFHFCRFNDLNQDAADKGRRPRHARSDPFPDGSHPGFPDTFRNGDAAIITSLDLEWRDNDCYQEKEGRRLPQQLQMELMSFLTKVIISTFWPPLSYLGPTLLSPNHFTLFLL